jgi:hypothetical protein
MPVIPPTPWQANTSKASNFPLKTYYKVTYTTKYTNEYACGILTNPAAGVIATNPTTVPIQAPIAESLCPRFYLKIPIPAAAAATVVVPSACTAIPLAPNAEPALKKPAKPQ